MFWHREWGRMSEEKTMDVVGSSENVALTSSEGEDGGLSGVKAQAQQETASGEVTTVAHPPAQKLNLIVKWGGKVFLIEDVWSLKTVRDLKVKIMEKTGVKVDRQKLLNLTYMGKGEELDLEISKIYKIRYFSFRLMIHN